MTFTTNQKSYNGLNQKSSNYSLDNANYGIKVLFDAVVDSTNYVKTSEEIKVYDYDEDDQNPTAWTCEIKTLKKDNDENSLVEIANNVIQDGYTQFQAIFTPLVTPTFTEDVDMTEVSGNPPTSESWILGLHMVTRTTSGTIATRDRNMDQQQANDTDRFKHL